MKIATRLSLLFLSAVFVVSGVLKVRAPDRFLLDVQAFEAVPYALAYLTALVLPWVEIFAGLGLWTRALRRGAALLVLLLALLFIALLGWARARGIELDCGCFGDWQPFPNFASHAAFNALLAAGALFLLAPRNRPQP